MKSATGFFTGLFVLIIGEYIIYQVVTALNLPVLINIIFIAIIPVVVIAVGIKAIKS